MLSVKEKYYNLTGLLTLLSFFSSLIIIQNEITSFFMTHSQLSILPLSDWCSFKKLCDFLLLELITLVLVIFNGYLLVLFLLDKESFFYWSLLIWAGLFFNIYSLF
jgi:hypothetical protein